MLKQVVPEEELAGPLDFGELIDEALQFLRNDIACKQIRLSVDRCDELEVLAPKHQLRLLLLGLLTQRIDDCPTGAEFSVRLERAENLAVFAVSSPAAPHPESSDARPSREPIYPGRVVLEWASKWLSRNGGRMELTRAEHSARSECRVYYPLRVVVPRAPATV